MSVFDPPDPPTMEDQGLDCPCDSCIHGDKEIDEPPCCVCTVAHYGDDLMINYWEPMQHLRERQ